MVLHSHTTAKAHSSSTITLSRIVSPATTTDRLPKGLIIICRRSMPLPRLSPSRMEKTVNERHSGTFADITRRCDEILHGSSLCFFFGGKPSGFFGDCY